MASHFLWPRFKRTRGAGVDALGVVGVRAGPPLSVRVRHRPRLDPSVEPLGLFLI